MSPTRTTSIAISALWIFILISSGLIERYVLVLHIFQSLIYLAAIVLIAQRRSKRTTIMPPARASPRPSVAAPTRPRVPLFSVCNQGSPMRKNRGVDPRRGTLLPRHAAQQRRDTSGVGRIGGVRIGDLRGPARAV